MTSYEADVRANIKELIDELKTTKDFKFIDASTIQPVDKYVEACTNIIIEEYLTNINNFEYSLHKDTIVPINMVAVVLKTHPYLINLFYRNMTDVEWKQYKERIIEGMHSVYGPSKKSEVEMLCEQTIHYNDTDSAVHKFKYFLGLNFEMSNLNISYDEVLSKIGDDCDIVLVHLSRNAPDKSVVIYKNIVSNKKELILNEDKVKALRTVLFAKRAYEGDKDYEIITAKNKATKFAVVLNYDDAIKLDKCTLTLATPIMPRSFMQRYLDGAVPSTIREDNINVYLQEWYFEQYNDVKEDMTSLRKALMDLRDIAISNYNENIDICINNILKDPKLSKVLTDERDRAFFATYIHGMKLILTTRRMVDVVEYVRGYMGIT